jgi:hypothetical protein
MAMLIAERPVSVFAAPIIDRSHCAGKSALGRHLPNHVLAGPSPDMGQAQAEKQTRASARIDHYATPVLPPDFAALGPPAAELSGKKERTGKRE